MDSAAQWSQVKEAFARAQEASPDERPAILAALPDLVRIEVTSLLAALAESPLPEIDAGGFGPGTNIGPYRVIGELGRGGMGAVYRAERADGEVRREVAVKVAGGRIFAPEAERRFIQERQILARLEHPHIVRLLDGGIAAGQRYFVMELVEGTPITMWCADRGLTLADRVRLFRQVCAALHYAHQRLVLHRDIKPANVLVTGDGQVKVLDFGIAQIVQPETLTADTRTALHPLSLACASPEQLRGEPLALTSDVYQLGTLLYEVLTGVNPQFRPQLSTEEALRLVLEVEPPRPSRQRAAVPRDLDAIVMKALAKAPGDRYQTVGELDADLARWLEGRPVFAVPPRVWYVAARFVRRNRLLSATAAALALSVVVGVAAVTRQARIAERRFEDARSLIHTTIFDIQPRLEAIPGTLELRQTLIEQTMKYLEAVSRDAGGNVPLLQELSGAYLQLARVSGDLSTSTLGNAEAARARFERARVLLDQALALEPGNPALLKDAALLHLRLATFQNTQGAGGEALATSEAAVRFAERNVAARPADVDAREILAGTVFTLALNTPAEQWEARRQRFLRAREQYRELAAANPAREPLVRNAGIVSRHLASLHYDKGRGAEAVVFAGEALDVSERVLASRPGDTALQLEAATDGFVLGMALDLAGRGVEAPALYERSRSLLGAVHTADASNARATLLLGEATRYFAANRLAAGDRAAARQLAREATGLFAKLAAQGPLLQVVRWRYAGALAVAADIDHVDGFAARACAGYRQAEALYTEADRQSPLVDMVARDFERVRVRADTCRP